eukprot:c23781_g5_i1 orf=119-2311(-)
MCNVVRLDKVIDLLQNWTRKKNVAAGRHLQSILISNESSVVNSGDYFIRHFAACGTLLEANLVFCTIVRPNVYTWHAISSAHVMHGEHHKAIDLYRHMQQEGISPNNYIFTCILKACCVAKDIVQGRCIHDDIIRECQELHVVFGSALIDMYAACGWPEEACKVFDALPQKDVVTFSALLEGLVQNECSSCVLKLMEVMQQESIQLDKVMFLSALKACEYTGSLLLGKILHNQIIKSGFEIDVAIGNTLIDMYAKCGSPELGRRVFDKLPERNVVVWTSMIAGYVQHGHNEEAMKLFWQMEREGVCPNWVTFVSILKACCSALALQSGKQIHALIRRKGLESDVVLQSSLVDMYSKCGSIEDAMCVCDQMLVQEGILWNGMIAGNVTYGHLKEALALFSEMEQRGVSTNEVTFVSVVKACANLHLIDLGKQIHLKIIETRADQNRILNNTLVDMYHKCGDIDGAYRVFSNLSERDVVSWNIVMAGHAVHEDMEEVLVLYRQMQQEAVRPDGVTFLSMLLACASLGALELGEQFHACVNGGCDAPAMPVSNTLIDMYAKCGSIEKAVHVFQNMTSRTPVSWNIVITGCAQHGCGKEALHLFEQMLQDEVRLDHVTLVAIVSACSHAGLLADGCYYFALMTQGYGIIPSEEAVASIVDLLGRAGHLKAAKVCMEETGSTIFAVVWKALLGACRIHGDWKLAKLAADSVLALEPEDAAAFVLWSNICAEATDL